MKTDYSSMPLDELERLHAKQQRKLIPANIVAIVIALVAALCQLFMPMVQVDVSLDGETFSAIASSMVPEEGGDGQAQTDEETQAMTEMITYVLQDADAALSVRIRPLPALSLGFSPSAEDVRTYLSDELLDMGDALDTVMAQAMPYFASFIVAQSAQAEFEEFEQVPVDEIRAVTDLIAEGRYDDAKSQFRAAASAYAQSIGHPLTAEQLEDVGSMFDDMVDSGVQEDNSFSYSQAFSAFVPEEDGDSSGAGGSFDLNGMMEDAFAEMDESTLTTIGMAVFLASAGTIGLTSALWLIMALIALLRIFLKNKKFTMWYVKLLCWLPCVLFVLVPTIAVGIMPDMIGQMGGEMPAGMADAMSGLPLAFGGSGIVSGICYVVLWLISIFWFFPVKRKARKMKKAIKSAKR